MRFGRGGGIFPAGGEFRLVGGSSPRVKECPSLSPLEARLTNEGISKIGFKNFIEEVITYLRNSYKVNSFFFSFSEVQDLEGIRDSPNHRWASPVGPVGWRGMVRLSPPLFKCKMY